MKLTLNRRRDDDTAAAPSETGEVTVTSRVVTSFDLLGGRAAYRRRRRLVYLVAFGLIGALGLGLVTRSAAGFVSAAGDQDRLNIAQSAEQQSLAAIRALTGNGASEEQMRNDLARIANEATLALSTDIDPAPVLSALQQRLPAEAKVRTVSLGAAEVADGSTDAARTQVEIIAVVPDLALLDTYVNAVRTALPTLQLSDTTWTGQSGVGDGLTVTITGTLPAGNPARVAQIDSQLRGAS